MKIETVWTQGCSHIIFDRYPVRLWYIQSHKSLNKSQKLEFNNLFCFLVPTFKGKALYQKIGIPHAGLVGKNSEAESSREQKKTFSGEHEVIRTGTLIGKKSPLQWGKKPSTLPCEMLSVKYWWCECSCNVPRDFMMLWGYGEKNYCFVQTESLAYVLLQWKIQKLW